MTEAVHDSKRLARGPGRRRSRMKGGVRDRDYAAELKLIRPEPSHEYWRALALGLLDLCQSHDPALTRLVGSRVLNDARADSVTVADPGQFLDLRSALARSFAKHLSDAKAELGRGKGKEPPTISDHDLLELYEMLKRAIAAIRPLERDMKADRVAELIVHEGGFFAISPFPAGRDRREALVRSLAEAGAAARVKALFKAAGAWAGLPDPSQRALDEAYRHFLAERATGEVTVLILAALIEKSAKTVENRLNRARRALRI